MQVGGDDGAVLDDCASCSFPALFMALLASARLIVRSDHATISAVSSTAWNSTSAPAAAHSLRDLLGLVVADSPSDAGAHDHHGRRDAVDPAGVVAGARDDVHVRVAELFGGLAHAP